MKKILVLFAHPAFQKSRINKILIQGIDDMEGITFHDLYQAYPEMDIDVKPEQLLVDEHDVIIFHHPFYWYSAPAMLKEWQDLVLQHGWAYGSQGESLKDKMFLQVLTTGGEQKAYCTEGYNRFTIRQLLTPFEQTANLCKMKYLPPFVVYGTHSINKKEVLKQRNNYMDLLSGLRDEQINIDDLMTKEYFNDYFIIK
ncbi:MAG: NAD(P)H-dependent oxidoreductase [Bacteroidales bacterium]|nr:NAD(P)H-dependent oxidoreductase [Bacteroidales bacterium]